MQMAIICWQQPENRLYWIPHGEVESIMPTITVTLPDELGQRLTALTKATQKPESFYVQKALERSLEDIGDACLAEIAYEQFKAGGEKAIPLEEVMREYGMES